MRNRVGVIGLVLVTVVAMTVFGGVFGVARVAQAAPAGEVTILLEGKALSTTGRLVNDTTLVSLKDIASDLEMTYSGRDNQAIVAYKDKRVTFSIGSNWAIVNGHEVLSPWTCTQEGDQVLVPLRFLMENMGFEVKWIAGPRMSVDIRPVAENPIVIGTVRERQETGTLQVDLQYPKIIGLDAAIQGQMNAFFANRTSRAVEQAYESEQANIAEGQSRWPTEVVLNYNVAYNRQNLVSMTFDDYLYMGGAHGMTQRDGYTVDTKTGTSYALGDLFKPGTDYVSLLSAEVKKQIDEQELATLGSFGKIRDDQDFYIKDDHLVVYFQQYELMAYAFGFPEFRIPMASLSSVLASEMAARSWAPAE